MTMELRHLRYFLAVADERHITRAAERLGIQQPPLSQQIAALERELDVKLLHRRARGVELTDAGQAFFQEARAILAQVDRAKDTARRTARGEEGRICIGVTSTAPFNPLVPRAIRAFCEARPGVSLVLEECLSNESLERLRSGQLDVAFIRTSLTGDEHLRADLLVEEPMVVALPSSHRLARGKAARAIPFGALASEVFILYGPPGTGMFDATIAACHSAGFNPRVGHLGASTQQAPRIGSTLSLVAAGLGITFVPASLQRMNLEGVVYRPLRAEERPNAVLSLARRTVDSSSVVEQFRRTVRAVVQAGDLPPS
jgi:DNA-binding transcriptional LysR family regulator